MYLIKYIKKSINVFIEFASLQIEYFFNAK
jgi:hypothetical protein